MDPPLNLLVTDAGFVVTVSAVGRLTEPMRPLLPGRVLYCTG